MARIRSRPNSLTIAATPGAADPSTPPPIALHVGRAEVADSVGSLVEIPSRPRLDDLTAAGTHRTMPAAIRDVTLRNVFRLTSVVFCDNRVRFLPP
jgi:hypothetical protein